MINLSRALRPICWEASLPGRCYVCVSTSRPPLTSLFHMWCRVLIRGPLLLQGKRQGELLQSCMNQLRELETFVTSRCPHPDDVLQLQVLRYVW